MESALEVWGPDGKRRMVKLEGGEVTVGRSLEATVSLPEDQSLSRHHLAIVLTPQGWVARDLKSKNGTILNGQRLQGDSPLRPGDRLEAGKTRIIFREGSQSAPVERVEFVDETERPPNSSTTIAVKLEALVKGEGQVQQEFLGTGDEAANRRVGALIAAGTELGGDRPLEELFPLILNLALRSTGATRGAILSLEKDELVTRATIGSGLKLSNTIRERVLRERASLLIRDTGKDSALALAQSLVMQKVRSLMAAPLQTKDRVIGMVYVDSPDLIRNFTAEDLNLLTVMANIAATRIEQRRLLEIEQTEKLVRRELEQAAVIQRGLFPEAAPQVPGWEIAGSSDPCREVGGDYYDYASMADGRTAVIVADVAGKGLPAAIMMSSLQARFMTLAEEANSADLLLTRLNRGITSKCPGNRFITAFLAVVEPGTGRVEYANAGHNPPLVRRSDGSLEWLKEGGPVLGILNSIQYGAGQFQLEPGDALVLYSDGVTEAPDLSDEEFGEERLVEACASLPDMSAADWIRDLRVRIWEHANGAPQGDDLTVVVLRRTN